jgi:putative flippase GtrA
MSWLKNTRRALDLRLLRFVIVGLANTGLGLATVYLLKVALGFADIPANAAGYGVGLAAAYALNSKWTFGYGGRTLATGGRFLFAFAISYGANLLAVWWLIERASLNSYVAQAAGIVPYTLCFYALCSLFVFRARTREADAMRRVSV